ncbi:MAG: FAD-dependent thymidylate synthase [Chitinivibrionales bacterium]|nr:FAD-dependent thymidylate synthase [Chitinivibrionales bacterium]
MAHCVVAEAEKILDKEFRVLDKGFVRLVDYMGSDERIVAAARVSYGEGTKTFREDKALIHYLMRNDHTSPFEQVVMTFHVKLPIFVARQWIRHRTARVNEISGRYSVMANEFYLPGSQSIALQSTNNKQGRSDQSVPPQLQQKVLKLLKTDQDQLYTHYESMVEENIARELARINLPLSLYTQWYWQIDLHNLFHFLKLRLDSHAQYEIRCYGETIAAMTKALCPRAYEAFEELVLTSATISKPEIEAIKKMLSGAQSGLDEKALNRLNEKLGLG